MRLEDMPPRLRRATLAALARDLDAKAQRPRPRAWAHSRPADEPRARPPALDVDYHPAGRDRYRCRRCGATFAAWAPAQRHADTHGGAAVDLLYVITGAL